MNLEDKEECKRRSAKIQSKISGERLQTERRH